ncbi:MAG: hypothetical protein ACRD5G_08385 [Candidatus Acidiferrales bacterium]
MDEAVKKGQDLKDVMDAEKRRGTKRRPLDAEQMRATASAWWKIC